MASVEEIGALIVSIRTDSAQFRAETEGARKGLENLGHHAALSSRSLARFGAIAAEQVIPGLRGSRVAIESVVVALSNMQSSFAALLIPIAKIAAAGAAGFLLGNAIRNFIELRQAGHGLVESLKLSVGITGDYAKATKDAAEEQKKFSAAQAANRAVIADLDKSLATLTEDYRKLADLAEKERRVRIQTLPLQEREAAQRKSALITEIELMTKRAEKEAEITAKRKEQADTGLKASQDLGLPTTGLVQGLRELQNLQDNIKALGNEFTRLAAMGIPARDLFQEIATAQAKIDDTIGGLKEKFSGVPIIFERLQDLQRSVGGGEFARGFDATARGILHVAEGSAKVEDELGNLVDVSLGKAKQGFGDTAEAATHFTKALEPLPATFIGLESGFVTVTGRLREVAEAFAEASRQALFFETVVGAGGNVAVAGPGNF